MKVSSPNLLRSLRRRLLLVAALLYALVCGLSWLVIDAAIEKPVRRAVDGQLEALARDLRGIWTTAQITGFPPEPPNTGDLHWAIEDERGEVFQSEVLAMEEIDLPTLPGGRAGFVHEVVESSLGPLAIAQQTRSEWPPAAPGAAASEPVIVTYTAAMSAARYDELISERADALRRAALSGFVAFGALMLALILALVAIVLVPLRRLERAAGRYGVGETPKIEGDYPSEIGAIVENLNSSIDRNEKLVERTRRYIAKIAHDLKHPIAITRNALTMGDNTDVAMARLDSMGATLDRYSALATSIGPEGPHPAFDLAPLLQDARESFLLLYRSAPLEIDVRCDPRLRLRMAQSDLDAILTNLLANAHRHAAGRILLAAEATPVGLTLDVEDDGPGLDAEAREKAVAWGARIDTSAPGSGFGLAIVADLAGLYEGTLELEPSAELGGLRSKVRLPLVVAPPSPR